MPRWAARTGLLALAVVVAASAGAWQVQAQQAAAPDELTDLTTTNPAPSAPGRDSDAMPNRTIESDADTPRLVVAPVLTVDQDRLFAESAWGLRAQRSLDEQGSLIAQENERLAAQLSAEEARLTQQRAALNPAEFRRLAEAFDSRATAVRRERAQAVQQLNAEAEADRTAFYQAALPVMGDMMQERGAVAVLDRRTVFVSLDAIDITGDLIRRLDEVIGDGERDADEVPATPGEDG